MKESKFHAISTGKKDHLFLWYIREYKYNGFALIELDSSLSPKGTIVTDEELKVLQIKREEFHGEWNYAILPAHQ